MKIKLCTILILVFASLFNACQKQPQASVLKPALLHELNLKPIIEYEEPKAETADSENTKWLVDTNRKWKYIIIHHSASEFGNSEIFNKWHLDRDFDELGYHFIITNGRGGPNGSIEIGSRWKKQKWGAHAGTTKDNDYNNYGIGICVVGNFTFHNPTVKQLQTLKKLVTTLANRYGILPANIITHRDVPNATTSCPGDYFYLWLQKEEWHETITVSSN